MVHNLLKVHMLDQIPTTVEFINLLIKEAPAAIAILDKNMRYLAYSDRWLTDYAISKTSIVGESHYDYFPDLRPEWIEEHQKALQGETIEARDQKFERLDNSEIWMRRKYMPWRDTDNNIAGIVIFNEVTTAHMQLLETLETLKKTNQELNDSKTLQNLILENFPDYIFIKDSDFKIVMANRNFINIYPPEKRDYVIGYTTFEEYETEEVDLFLEMDKKALMEGYSEIIEHIISPDGVRRTLFTKKIRFENNRNEAYILGIAIDVTERETLIKTLKDQNEELAAFSYRASHDLKGPLVSMQRLASYIYEDLNEGEIEEAKENILKIQKQSENLVQLVADILDLTKATLKDVVFEKVNITAIIENLLDKYDMLIKDNDVEIRFDKDMYVLSEATRITQILENLIINGVNYADVAKTQRFVSISLEQKKNSYQLLIEDNGIGIPAEAGEDIYKLFTRYNTLADGTGIGMAIVKKHVDKLDGKIGYTSSEQGTLFKLIIPGKIGEVL